MFSLLKNEVALGREHSITADDSSLKKPPANYDSVVARGQTEPGLNLSSLVIISVNFF